MKNKKLTLFGAFAVALTVVPAMTACGNKKGEQIDTSKTQIYVNNFCRGFGGEWLTQYKKEFEELHANDSYETGKKGVQILISNARGPASESIDTILSGRDEIYFTEQSDFFTLFKEGVEGKNVLHEITDVVSEKLPNESRSILDKMSDGQKEYLNVGGKYYAIPHYSGYFGLTYDKDLFDKKLFYFNKDRDDFVVSKDEERSVGPDGVAGTSDDGLPITYEEFLKLCKFMTQNNVMPMTASGQTGGYINLMIENFIYNDLGYDQSALTFTCDGTAKDCVEINKSGQVVSLGDLAVTPATGYNVYKTRSRYEALKLYENINSVNSAQGKKRYILDKIDSNAYSAGQAQWDFLASGIPGAVASGFQRIAMIAEGSWWNNEAKATFNELSDLYGQQYSIKNRNLAFMPLPTATEQSDHQNVLLDHLSALMFMKANVSETKYPLLKEFMQFCNTDHALVEFSEITNSTKALDYEIPEASLDKMTSFGRSLYNIQRTSKVVYPYNSTKFYRNNAIFFHYDNQLTSQIGNDPVKYVINAFRNNGCTGETYFSGMVSYYTTDWKNRTL